MPKNSNKNVKKGAPVKDGTRLFIEKDNDHEYGLVTKKLGGGKFTVVLNLSEKEVIGKIRGKLKKGANKKNNFVDIGCVVLVGIRDFEEDTVDIVYVYTPDEVRKMKKDCIISDKIADKDTETEILDEEVVFDFAEI